MTGFAVSSIGSIYSPKRYWIVPFPNGIGLMCFNGVRGLYYYASQAGRILVSNAGIVTSVAVGSYFSPGQTAEAPSKTSVGSGWLSEYCAMGVENTGSCSFIAVGRDGRAGFGSPNLVNARSGGGVAPKSADERRADPIAPVESIW